MLEVLRRIVVLSLVCARSHALLELMQAHAKPEAAFGTPVDMQRAASGMGAGRPLGPQNLQEGAGRPLGPQNPQNPQTPRPMVAANPANPANPAAPATNLQGALRMSMGSLMGFCRCEGLSLHAARSASPDPPPPFAFVTSPATPHIHGGAP